MRISDDPKRWEPGSLLKHEKGRDLVVEAARGHRDRFLVTFEGVETRSEAELLRGALYVAEEEKRELEEDEYWLQDLVGCRVETVDGDAIGEVVDVIEAPAQDLLVVSTPDGERYVPMVKEIVPSVDVAARTVTVAPPDGLLD